MRGVALTLIAVVLVMLAAARVGDASQDRALCVAREGAAPAAISVVVRASEGRRVGTARFAWCGPGSSLLTISGLPRDARAIVRAGGCRALTRSRPFYVGFPDGDWTSANPPGSTRDFAQSGFVVEFIRIGSRVALACGAHGGVRPLQVSSEGATRTGVARRVSETRYLLPGRGSLRAVRAGAATEVRIHSPGTSSSGDDIHLRPGTCRSLAAGRTIPLWPLAGVDGDTSTTVVDVPLRRLVRERWAFETLQSGDFSADALYGCIDI